jgi:hypothetical protein
MTTTDSTHPPQLNWRPGGEIGKFLKRNLSDGDSLLLAFDADGIGRFCTVTFRVGDKEDGGNWFEDEYGDEYEVDWDRVGWYAEI